MTYLLAGGYALLHRRHVRIDVIYETLSRRRSARLDVVTFVFFVVYAGDADLGRHEMAWASFLHPKTTGSPWNPPIWPVKMASRSPACCCCCRASPTCSATSASAPTTDPRDEHRAAQLLFVVVFVVILLAGPAARLRHRRGRGDLRRRPVRPARPDADRQPRLHPAGQQRAGLGAAVHLHGLHARASGHRRGDLQRRHVWAGARAAAASRSPSSSPAR